MLVVLLFFSLATFFIFAHHMDAAGGGGGRRGGRSPEHVVGFGFQKRKPLIGKDNGFGLMHWEMDTYPVLSHDFGNTKRGDLSLSLS